jgi:3'-phosphoadenosine 5'-phosphosulfate (PAPS) 3'-phosphatase
VGIEPTTYYRTMPYQKKVDGTVVTNADRLAQNLIVDAI